MVDSGKLLHQIGEDSVGMPLVGTPGSLAAQMDEAMQHIGDDGSCSPTSGRLAGMSTESVKVWSPRCKHADLCARRTSSRPSANLHAF